MFRSNNGAHAKARRPQVKRERRSRFPLRELRAANLRLRTTKILSNIYLKGVVHMKLTLRTVIGVSVLVMVWSLEACQKCLDKGSIEMREECKVCKGRGTTVDWDVQDCRACYNGRKSYADSGVSHSHGQGTFCRRCSGTGEIKNKKVLTCESCAGKGYRTNRIPCPSCGGKSGAETGAQPQAPVTTAPGASSVPKVEVEACKLCGPDGKVKKTITCEQCESGYCHKKETQNGKDVFTCRKCGKACDERYTPCACKKPDCTSCGGTHQRVEAKTCEVCGGDGIITPLEKARAEGK